MRNGNEAANRTDLQKLIISGGRQCGKTSVLAKILKPENPSKIRSLTEKVETLTQQNDYLRKRVEELEDQKHKLKWRLAYQAMHHVRLHNRWVCGELEAPEEEAVVNPFMYAETEVWWAIGDEADDFGKELRADDEAKRADELAPGGEQ